MWNCGSHSACSTNWKSEVEGSKRTQMTSDKARSTSDVQSAIQRALRATSASAPRRIMMQSTPKVGRKVTRLSSGQLSIALTSADLEQEIPRHQHDDADQHREGIVIEVTGLEAARADGKAPRCRRKAVRAEAVDGRAIAFLPEAIADCHCGAHDEEIVDFVEIPFVEEQKIDRLERARGPGGHARLPNIRDPGHEDAEEAHRQRQLADPERHAFGAGEGAMIRQYQNRFAPERRMVFADEIVEAEEAGNDGAD